MPCPPSPKSGALTDGLGHFVREIGLFLLDALAELVTREARHRQRRAGFLRGVGDQTVHADVAVANVFLLDEADFRVELVDLAVDDLVDDLLGLARSESLLA